MKTSDDIAQIAAAAWDLTPSQKIRFKRMPAHSGRSPTDQDAAAASRFPVVCCRCKIRRRSNSQKAGQCLHSFFALLTQHLFAVAACKSLRRDISRRTGRSRALFWPSPKPHFCCVQVGQLNCAGFAGGSDP